MSVERRPSFSQIYRRQRRIAANEPFARAPSGPRGWLQIGAVLALVAVVLTWHAHRPLALVLAAGAAACATGYTVLTARRVREVRAHPDPITPEQVRAASEHAP